MLSKILIIQGIAEEPDEGPKEIHTKIEQLAVQLGLSKLDYDNARRVGWPTAGRTRAIELTLLRQKDKMEILAAKSKVNNDETTRKVYINPARTQMENRHRRKLMEFART